MKSFKVEEIKEIIKSLLKKNKLTYSDLAEHLECSEPTVKRILGPEELSLTRLMQICDFLKMSLSDIETMMKKEERVTTELNEKQQNFLVENKNHFAYLMELYQGLSPEKITEKYNLSAKSNQKYLINLEKFDLIKVTSKNKVKPNYPTFPHLGNGPLGIAYYRAFIQNTSAFFIDHIGEEIARNRSHTPTKNEGSGFAVMTMSVTKNTYKQFMKELEEKLREIERIAAFEEKTMDPKKLKTAVISLGSACVDEDYKGLTTLSKAFGEITNL